jgi:hypothetical protein
MSTKTAVPMVKNVKRPTILQPKVQAKKKPVAHIQAHHSRENSLTIIYQRVSRKPDELCLQIADFSEANVSVKSQSHEENEGGVEEDKSCLGNVSIIFEKMLEIYSYECDRMYIPKHTRAAEKEQIIMGKPHSFII